MPAPPTPFPPSPRGEAASPPPLAGSAPAVLTPWQEKIARNREHRVTTFEKLRAGGLTVAAAASEAGCAISSIWRWKQLLAENGLPGLIPKVGKGVAPLINPAVYTPAVVTELQRLAVKLGGIKAAALAYAKDPACPKPLARYILARGCVPDKLRALIGLRRVKRPVRIAGNFTFVEGAGLDQQAA